MVSVTIFTPTYNRAHTLPALHKSLLDQTCFDFEWLIVDDSSTDDTEQLVAKFIEDTRDFKIRYYKQEHGGKHRAINLAVNKADAKMFFIVDSDDTLLADAVEKIKEWSRDTLDNNSFAGVSGLKCATSGKVWGVKSNDEIAEKIGTYVDATNFEREENNLLGDKAEVYKTDILKKFPFPEFENEFFVTEAVCWDAIAAAGYKIRWYYYSIYQCEYLEDGLTKNGANEIPGRLKNFKGYCYYVKQSMNVKRVQDSIVVFRAYNKTCKAGNLAISDRAKCIYFSVLKYLWYLCVIMPALYSVRIVKKIIK